MSKPNFAEGLSSLPSRRNRVKAALAQNVPEEADEPKTVDIPGQVETAKPQLMRSLEKANWSTIKSGLNTRIPEDMKRLLDDLVWVRGKEATNTGKAKPQIQDIVTEAIGDLLNKDRALLEKYDLL